LAEKRFEIVDRGGANKTLISGLFTRAMEKFENCVFFIA
jgi:hypothetical protein